MAKQIAIIAIVNVQRLSKGSQGKRRKILLFYFKHFLKTSLE